MSRSANGPLRVGVGGPVGSGKTTLVEMLCKAMRERYDLVVVTNDIYTKEDQRLLTVAGALEAERIMGVETGGCPHTAIREDASINLEAVDRMLEKFPNADIVFIESGGDNLAATFSPELSDLTIYVIDVAAGEKIPRKGGPGITKSDLFVINKTDLAPYVGANLDVMAADTKRMRGARPFVMSNTRVRTLFERLELMDEGETASLLAEVEAGYADRHDDLDATLKVEGGRDRQSSTTYVQLIDCPPSSPFVASGFCSAGLGMGLPSGIDVDKNAKKPGDGTDLATSEYVLDINYSKWGHTFSSVSGFYNYRFSINVDGDLTPIPLLTAEAPEHYSQFSQEFRVTSPVDQPIEYLAGIYFQTDRLTYSQDFNYFFLTPTIQSGWPSVRRCGAQIASSASRPLAGIARK